MKAIFRFIKNYFSPPLDFDASLEIDRLIAENDALRERIAKLEAWNDER